MPVRYIFTLLLLHASLSVCLATPLSEYQRRLQQAINALDTLAQPDESETETERSGRITETLNAVRTTLPKTESVEWTGAGVRVDNEWLHRELEDYERVAPTERDNSLARVTERLQALEQRVAEIESAIGAAGNKTQASKKLAEILQRPEYVRHAKQTSALSRLWNDFWKWLQNLIPRPKPLAPGSAGLLTQVAQVFVVLLAVGVLAYVIRMFAPRLFRQRRSKKEERPGPRIVLGEKLEPDQSASDLLADAEALARRGELRAAIRKAYIALLVELGERKVLSLEQHKTNRDYLRAMQAREPLHANVKQLTDSFERHWYGFAVATEADWEAFRARHKQALLQ